MKYHLMQGGYEKYGPRIESNDLDEMVERCKEWRHIYAMSDYYVIDDTGEIVFPADIKTVSYGAMGGFLTRHERYE